MKTLLIASICAVLAVFITMLLITGISAKVGGNDLYFLNFFMAGVASFVAAIVVLVWAIPVHLILRKFNQTNVLWYLGAAVVPSLVFVYGLKPFGHDSPSDMLIQALTCSFIGAVAASTFWYLAVLRKKTQKRI